MNTQEQVSHSIATKDTEPTQTMLENGSALVGWLREELDAAKAEVKKWNIRVRRIKS